MAKATIIRDLQKSSVTDVQVDGSSIVNDGVANLDSSQFGTYVEANPSDPPTDDLTSIQIGDTVFDIPGGGGGGSTIMMSNFYSEDEQVVGRWIDGKPVYQRVVIKQYDSSTRGIGYSYAHNIADIDTCVYKEGFYISDTGTIQGNRVSPTSDNSSCSVNGGAVVNLVSFNRTALMWDLGEVWTRSEYMPDKLVAIVRYTKTTDAPGTGPTKGNLIYLPTLYSEEEREVGVWTDGKPLYQKTLTIPSMPNNTTVSIEHNIANVENIWVYDGFAHSPTTGYFNSVNLPNASTSSQWHTAANISYIYIWAGSNRTGYNDVKITVRYTKTTDTPGSGTWTPEGQLAHHYSTSEHIVGTWIDGSPIYERTWDLGATTFTIKYNEWTQTPIPKDDIAKIVNCDGMQNDGTKVVCAATPTRNDYIYLQTRRNTNEEVRYVTIQYLKTTS